MLLKRNKKHFLVIFEGLSIKQITQTFLEGESPTLSLHLEEVEMFWSKWDIRHSQRLF